MQYRRAKTPGATYFFTVVTYQRQTIFDDGEMVELLRQCFRVVKQRHPFVIEAMVVLREHLHCIWTLPDNDANFSMRWRLIKTEFSRRCRDSYKRPQEASRVRKGEQPVWQRRFWEHQIRDERDFQHHVDYIHFNPVHHGLVTAPKDWDYSSFHRYVRDGCYPIDWGADGDIKLPPNVGSE
ncbi:REP-associated tyrosine transposase [Coleofasciculus chthonoplastes]|uniref:REP-associated tyrosine transposase n=1 Tax=Coleofasciculus chthonoplastes TaxID=64178 RepID=UPI0032FD0613